MDDNGDGNGDGATDDNDDNDDNGEDSNGAAAEDKDVDDVNLPPHVGKRNDGCNETKTRRRRWSQIMW